jgi:Fic family protein
VDPTEFVAPEWGRAVRTPSPGSYVAFIPEHVPRELALTPDTVLRLSEADAALGRLAGSGRLLPDPHLLVSAYITREAVSSSRIEGTQASVTEVFDAAVTGKSKRNDIREVRNYVAAVEHGVRRMQEDDFPISLRLIKEMHKILLTGVRGYDKTPGEFRTTQNWINSPDNRPTTATFVPPPVHEMWQALDDWEKYLHDEAPRLPMLVRCALLHYQFETIHPFLDGNGRMGRVFIVLYLMDRGRLPAPLLYLSAYLDRRKNDYYDGLQAIREHGSVTEWLQFFLDGVAVQANDAVDRAEQLSDLREDYRSRLRAGGRAHQVVDLLFANPILTVRYVQEGLGLSQPGATNILRKLGEVGILYEVGKGPGVRHRWVCHDVLRVLDPESGAMTDAGP